MTADTPPNAPPSPKLNEILTREEIARMTARSNLRGAWVVVSTWGLIALAFAFLARFPTALGWVVAVVLLAGRQLALAILMHEGAHRTLFRTRWLNDFVADWLCGRPIWADLRKYRLHHLAHHAKTGTNEDTDLSLVTPFPTTKASLVRRFARDLLGMTGLKFLVGRILMDAGILKYTVAHDAKRLPRRALHLHAFQAIRAGVPMLVTNLALFGALAATGHAWMYGAWVLAYMTVFTLFVRIRSMAEHACTERTTDMFRNTRTTRAGWLARLTVAPLRVNYHLEHHVVASVPYFRLPELHRMLRDRGLLSAPPGYWDVLKLVSSRRPVHA